MSRNEQPRRTRSSKPELPWMLALRYAGAMACAWGGAEIGFHTAALAGIRLALSFCVILATALTIGSGPAAAALVVTGITFRLHHLLAHPAGQEGLWGALPTLIILLAGGLTVLLIQRRYMTDRALRTVVQKLLEQAEALVQAQQASGSAAWSFDARTQSTRWYEGGAEIFGRPHAEITALGSPLSLILEEDRPRVTAALDLTTRTGVPFRAEYRVRWPTGEVHWLEARGTPLAKTPHIWHGATIDITDRKRAEEALIQTEKLALAGRLAASIAHEINNPLEAVTNLLYLARLTAVNPETERYIHQAEEELSRVAQITSQTLRFHRQQSAAVETDIAELVRSLIGLFENKMQQSSIAVDLRERSAPGLVCYAGEIRQVLANLIGNAVDAMPEGGTLRLSVRPATDWATGLVAVRITVADTGCGIPQDSTKRIFEPFFTTKADIGTGLGLWVSATLVGKHNGRVAVRSSTRPGQQGTVFSVLLPYGGTVMAFEQTTKLQARVM